MQEAFLADIVANPDDDTPRLVYADWLDENGQPERAEFIRTQIRREGLKWKDPERAELLKRETELLALHADEWLRHLPEWARQGGDRLAEYADDCHGFRRGFLQGVSAPDNVATFLKDAPKVFAREPITHLYLAERDFLPRLGGSPQLLGLTGLQFSHYTLEDYGTRLLARLPAMPRLRFLWLYKQEMGDSGLRALARWPGLATVRDLQLGFNYFQAPGLKALMASPHLGKRLKWLGLEDSLIDEKTKQALRERFGKVVSL